MLVAMIPAAVVTTTATTAVPTGNWTDAGNYDISWCTTLETADAAKTVTVGDKHYYVKGAETNVTYTIDTPAKLAGLAYLVSLADADCFKKDTFVITADLDLGAHNWTPIAMNGNEKFRGSLIGAKGGVADASITISNMTINNTTENTFTGLVGRFGGKWIKNIDLENANITATNYAVGSFVGAQDGNLGFGVSGDGGYQNISSDAKITVTSQRTGDQKDAVGGIVGYIFNCNIPTVITDLVFTGTISAPYADNVGGILGLWQSNETVSPTITNCVVISEKIEWGKNNIFISSGAGHNVGCGGIAGNLYANSGSLSIAVSNCYVAANIVSLATEGSKDTTNVGGIVGASCSQTKSFSNCQFDGIITGKAGAIGAVLGRYLADKATVVENTVISGIALRSAGNVSAYMGGNKDNLTVTNSFNAINMISGNGGTEMPAITSTTDFTALLAITVSDTDDTKVWTKGENDLYPILAIAVPYLTADAPSVAKSGADITWFVPSANSFTISTKAQLDGLALVLDAYGVDNSSVIIPKITIDESLAEADLSKYSEHAYVSICNIMGIDPTAVLDTTKVNVQLSQISLVANEKGNYDVRIVAKINDGSYKNVYFNYNLDQDGEITKSMTTPEITTCYRKLIEVVNGEEKEIVAEDGYYVVFVIPNVTFKEVESSVLAVRAYATGGDGTVYYSGQHVNITLAAPTAN